MRRYTITEIAEKLGVDKDAARGLVRFLVKIDLIQNVGTRFNTREAVYWFDEAFAEKMSYRVKEAQF